MIKTVARFYLLALALTFSITMLVGGTGAPFHHIVTLAMLSWPLSALILVTEAKLIRLLAHHQTAHD